MEICRDGTMRGRTELAGRITTYVGSILALIPSRSSGRISLPVHHGCRAGQSRKRCGNSGQIKVG